MGWIKLHRKLSEKAFYSKDSEKVHLWVHLLFKANRKPREEMLGGKPYVCKCGQFTTGRKQLSLETGISESKIERILNNFEKIEQQIEQLKTSKNRLITILSWSDYQSTEQQIEQQVNNNRTTSEQQVNTLQEVKEIKEYKKRKLSELKDSDVENSEILNVAQSFQKLFISNLIESGSPTTTIDNAKGTWYDDIRLMIEKDGATVEMFRKLFVFLGEDPFWKSNILSTKTLRKQLPKLLLKIKSNESTGANRTKQGASLEEIGSIFLEEFADLPEE